MKRQFKKIVGVSAAISAILLSGCTLSTIDAGTEGVMTYQPYLIGSGGVDKSPIESGAIWTAISTKVDRYNIKPVKVAENFVDLTASDNVAIDFDVYVTLKIDILPPLNQRF